jgi:hypothetical protein
LGFIRNVFLYAINSGGYGPQIEFRWKEAGLSFQVQFVKLNYVSDQELGQELRNQKKYSEILEN